MSARRRSAALASADRPACLQSTLGNLPELFIVVFALRAGEIVVAQTSILGSLLANALLDAGPGDHRGRLRASTTASARFHTRLPNDTTMLPDARRLHDRDHLDLDLARRHGRRTTRRRSRSIGAVLILCVYGAWLANYLTRGEPEPAIDGGACSRDQLSRGHRRAYAAQGSRQPSCPSGSSPSSTRPVSELGISKAFTGLVIVAIAGNAVENVVGIQLGVEAAVRPRRSRS